MDFADFIVPPVKCMTIGALVALVCCATALTRADRKLRSCSGWWRAASCASALAILLVSAVFDLAV